MYITYKNDRDFSRAEVYELFNSVGWTGVGYSASVSLDRLMKGFVKADYICAAFNEHNKLVGLIEGIDDGFHAFVAYLLVHPDYQSKGIGSKLLTNLKNYYKGYYISLLTASAQQFYEKHGLFARIGNGGWV